MQYCLLLGMPYHVISYKLFFLFVHCVGLVIITCQMIGQKDFYEDAYLCQGEYLHKDQVEECFCVFGSVYCFIVCLSLALHDTFHMPMA